MYNFVGISNFNKGISTLESTNIITMLTDSNYNVDKEDIYTSKYTSFGLKKLNIVSLNKQQIMSLRFNDNTYTIVYNGKLYNSKDIKNELTNKGFEFER